MWQNSEAVDWKLGMIKITAREEHYKFNDRECLVYFIRNLFYVPQDES